MTYEISDKLIEKLTKLSLMVPDIVAMRADPDYSPYDWYGGNMDDAYWAGNRDGMAELASEILQDIRGGIEVY